MESMKGLLARAALAQLAAWKGQVLSAAEAPPPLERGGFGEI